MEVRFWFGSETLFFFQNYLLVVRALIEYQEIGTLPVGPIELNEDWYASARPCVATTS